MLRVDKPIQYIEDIRLRLDERISAEEYTAVLSQKKKNYTQ